MACSSLRVGKNRLDRLCLPWAHPTLWVPKSSPVTTALTQRGSRWVQPGELQSKSSRVTPIFFSMGCHPWHPWGPWWLLSHQSDPSVVPQCLGCVYVSCGGTSTGSSWDQIPFFPGTVALLLKGKLCVRGRRKQRRLSR